MRLSKKLVFVQSDPRHVSRIVEFFPEMYENVQHFETHEDNGMVSFETDHTSSFPEVAYQDELCYRYINRYFSCTYVSDSIDLVNIDYSSMVVRFQFYPQTMAERAQELLPVDMAVSPTEFTHVLNIVHLNEKYYYGFFPKGNLFCANKIYDALHVPKISRAYHKIVEGIIRGNIPINDTWRVFDIGAAPGGWSQHLCTLAGEVVAVDKANMLFDHPKLTFMQMRAEEALKLLDPASFDLVVCDINLMYEEIFEILLNLQHLIKPGGYLLFTVKMPRRNPKVNCARLLRIVPSFLETFPNFDVQRAWWMLANLKERTVVSRKKLILN
eukprot:TRINITY_DN7933_c0_g1_i1.p1 TRINITY_DN7933_c0_g1~~TRINITY_DN7933_c0_g1_i1.p1  ORF type:complete len:327 (+),score=60.29 TRINITY_DN7933_c0_g1_i1:14-994(+)